MKAGVGPSFLLWGLAHVLVIYTCLTSYNFLFDFCLKNVALGKLKIDELTSWRF